MPNFFSPEYDARNSKKLVQVYAMGTATSAMALLLAAKTYQVKMGRATLVDWPLAVLGISIVQACGMRACQQQIHQQQKALERHGIRLMNLHPERY